MHVTPCLRKPSEIPSTTTYKKPASPLSQIHCSISGYNTVTYLSNQMESAKQKCKRVWKRCRRCHVGSSSFNILSKARESFGKNKKKKHGGELVAPEGCLWVCVGPERERFAMRIELANHPVFKMLLDDAESEYGFRNNGPIWLPCGVSLFSEALEEMEMEMEEDRMSSASSSWGCAFHHPKSYPNSVMHSPLSYHSNHSCAAEYELLSPYRVYV